MMLVTRKFMIFNEKIDELKTKLTSIKLYCNQFPSTLKLPNLLRQNLITSSNKDHKKIQISTWWNNKGSEDEDNSIYFKQILSH